MASRIYTVLPSSLLTILQLPIIHSVCPPLKNALGKIQHSQEHLKTMVYAEFGWQTECIMGNWKIENSHLAIHEDFKFKRFILYSKGSFFEIFFEILGLSQ